jgi:hypothetical protein
MLEAALVGIFSWAFTVSSGGETVAAVTPAWFSEQAEVTVAGKPYTLARESVREGTFAMRSGGRVVASARKPSAFFRAFEVELPGRCFELKAVSVWGREFGLYEGEVLVGRIGPASWLGRAAVLDLPDALLTEVQVFLFWLRAAKARALTMGSKQLWSEYSAASKQTPNGFRNSCEREAWPNNSLQQAPGGRSATPRRSSAQGRVRANTR